MNVKFLLRQVDVFEIGRVIDEKGHGQDENARFFSLPLCNAAVTVRNDSRFSHKYSLFFRPEAVAIIPQRLKTRRLLVYDSRLFIESQSLSVQMLHFA